VHVYVLTFFGAVISLRKAQLVDLTNDGQLSAAPGFHSFATTARLHHLSSTRFHLSDSSRIWLGDSESPD
jgi:hypothetical protein